ncbi:MAG: RT0821/Lpp0805 family surface protein [Labrys sp. (in: a-proteobacteria)]|jgi:surface antigen
MVLYTLRRVLRPLVPIVASLGLAGCAVSTSLGPLFSKDDITGSIPPSDGRFSTAMTDADWTAARTAVEQATADPAAGASTTWENPQTGLRGTVTPVANAFASESGTCRAFLATLVSTARTDWYQGRACHGGNGLSVGPVEPFTPPPAS